MSDGKMKKVDTADLKVMQKDATDIEDAMGTGAKEVIARASGKKFMIRPCPLSKLPELAQAMTKIQEAYAIGEKNGMNDIQLISDPETGVMDAIAEVIKIGIASEYPDMSTKEILDHFALGDFPLVYNISLDMNDFLSNMGKMVHQ
jgi:hypothetical protein